MNKYVFIYYGYDTSSPDLEKAWHDWFTLRADHFVDPGNPFGPGREVTPTAATDVSAEDTQPSGTRSSTPQASTTPNDSSQEARSSTVAASTKTIAI